MSGSETRADAPPHSAGLKWRRRESNPRRFQPAALWATRADTTACLRQFAAAPPRRELTRLCTLLRSTKEARLDVPLDLAAEVRGLDVGRTEVNVGADRQPQSLRGRVAPCVHAEHVCSL